MEAKHPINMTDRQQGFTIIELVVVILLLGILTATALPRFLDVTDEAHQSVVDGVQGGLQTGVALFRAQWVANGQAIDGSAVTGFGDGNLVTNAFGYPKGVSVFVDSGTASERDTACVEVYSNVLQPGFPSIAEAPTDNTAPTQAEIDAATTDFLAFSPSESVCSFAYVAPGDATPGTLATISYDATAGTFAQ